MVESNGVRSMPCISSLPWCAEAPAGVHRLQYGSRRHGMGSHRSRNLATCPQFFPGAGCGAGRRRFPRAIQSPVSAHDALCLPLQAAPTIPTPLFPPFGLASQTFSPSSQTRSCGENYVTLGESACATRANQQFAMRVDALAGVLPQAATV